MNEKLVTTERRDWVIGVGGEETIFKVSSSVLIFIKFCAYILYNYIYIYKCTCTYTNVNK